MSSQSGETEKTPVIEKRRGSRRIRPWQALAIVAVLVLGGAGGYFGYTWVAGGSTPLTEGQQLVPVTRGDLTNQVSSNGSVVFPEREMLTFGAPGTVGAVLVTEGEDVEEGQVLAYLDESAVARLEYAVAQAEVAAQDAKDRLAEARQPADALALAQAESAIAAAGLGLEEAQEAFDAILMTSEQKRLDPDAWPADVQALVQAEAAVAAAETALQDAKDRLAETEEPAGTSALLQVETAVTAAKRALQQAQEDLDALLAPDDKSRLTAAVAVTSARRALENAGETLADLEGLPDPEAVGTALDALETAQESYNNAVADLSAGEVEWSHAIADAEQAQADAETAYSGVFKAWLGVAPSADDVFQEPAAILAAWGADLDAIYPQVDYSYYRAVPVDDPATPWNENLVFLWTRMLPGTVTGTCDSTRLTRGTRCVTAELESAWDTFDASLQTTETTRSQSANALTAAREAVNRAQDSLSAAGDALEQARTPATDLELEDARQAVQVAETNLSEARERVAELDDPDPLAVESARSGVQSAEIALADAQASLDDVGNPDPLTVASARSDADLARARLAEARDRLAALESPNASEIASARADLEVAKARLTDAQATLEDLRQVGTDELVISLREMELRDTQTALEDAKGVLDGITIRAPWTGTIGTVAVEEGQTVNAATGAFEIVDLTIAEVAAVVDEIDVLSVAVGAQASIVMDALPGQALPGTVVEIGKAAGSSQSVVTYPVSVRIETPEGLRLVEGLSATANVVLQQETGVLLVPNQAVGGSYVQPTVRVSRNGNVTEVPVVLGSSDDFWVVVRSGLVEGDQVVMEGVATSAAADLRLQRGGMQAIPFQGSADARKLESK
ncbi:MAG: efflux RND transporter periplasmic adaptor subunit [Chloroflexi bacterium]|nr:efflux RND transporter periplasmic adaptor subunit [Chloroflexota bacterium]